MELSEALIEGFSKAYRRLAEAWGCEKEKGMALTIPFLHTNLERLCLCWCFCFFFCSSLCWCFFSSLCSKCSSLLLGNLSSSSLVGKFLSLGILLSLPCRELCFCSSLVKCAFLHTTEEVLLHIDAFRREDVADCVCWFCACEHPFECALKVQINS